MANILFTRLKQGHRTIKFPKAAPPAMPERFRGRPLFDAAKCLRGCELCVKACPTGAIARDATTGGFVVDLGRCLFCVDCASACPRGAIRHSQDYRLSVRERAQLSLAQSGGASGAQELVLAAALDRRMKRLFGRSLKLRQVSAGGCGACEADVNVLGTIGWDLGRFGIQFVASPRHADGILVTGPVTPNMALALGKTWDAVPDPKIVIATGTCAISGGLYARTDGEQRGVDGANCGAEGRLEVDLFIPGCPPHPLTILDGLLRLLGRIEDGTR